MVLNTCFSPSAVYGSFEDDSESADLDRSDDDHGEDGGEHEQRLEHVRDEDGLKHKD